MGAVQVDPLTVAPRPARFASMLVYVVALAGWVTVMGLPKQAMTAFGWIWLATIAWNIRAPLRTHLDFVRDWSLPLAVLTVYLYSRGLADDLGFASVHVTAPIEPTAGCSMARCPPSCSKRTCAGGRANAARRRTGTTTS